MPANYSTNIVYLSKAQYQELLTNQTISVSGTTVTYNENDIYVTPQEEPYIKPANGIPAADLASGVVPVQDVQINGSSILSNGVASIPYADSENSGGIVRAISSYGITFARQGLLSIDCANSTLIKAGSNAFYPIVPYFQHESIFYGLAKAAGDTTQSQSDNAVGTYTTTAAAAIRSMLGAAASTDIPSVPVRDVQVNGTSVLNNGVANVPVMGTDTFGVAKRGSGLAIDNGLLKTNNAGDDGIKTGASNSSVLTPGRQHVSVFYGLAKAAGADMKDITNTTVGTYPDAQKAAIQNMLGITSLFSTEEASTATAAHIINSTFMMDGKLHRATSAIAIGDAVEVGTNCEVVKADEVFVKKTDIASSSTYGVVKAATYGVAMGSGGLTGYLVTYPATADNIKSAAFDNYCLYRPITPYRQHEAVYYGLSKLAGVDLASETATVGTYSTTSQAAIRNLIGAGTPLDVQINGTSIVSSGIANIPKAKIGILGVVKPAGMGIDVNESNGELYIVKATTAKIKAGTANYVPIVPSNQHESVFYGLSKVAGVDLASVTVTVGTYPENSKVAIRNMLGAVSSDVIAVQDTQPTDADNKIWLPETEPTGVEVPTYAEFQALDAAVVKKTDIASTTTVGIVKAKDYGIKVNANGELYISKAEIASEVKSGVANYLPIVPSNQHAAVFYGLSKVAGVDLANETVTLGTYSATASAAIRNMLGAVGDVQIDSTSIVSNGIANIPVASTSTLGVVGIGGSFGIKINENGKLYIDTAGLNAIKSGNVPYSPISAMNQHQSVFYGLAKAAGDTTQAASDNAVGTYTTEAKAAIHTMLGIDPASIAAQVDIPLVETVTGTTPSITGQPNVRYVCGEISTLSLTPPASGSVDVIFESGSTATTLTVPNTVKWPAWFDAETLETNTIYEVLITDGVYGSVMTWAT